MAALDAAAISLVVLVPFVGALALILIPSRQSLAVRAAASSSAGAALLLSAYLALRFFLEARDATGYWNVVRYDWLPSFGVSFQLGMDGISALMVLLNGVVAFAGVLIAYRLPEASKEDHTKDDRMKDFYVLFLLLVAGVFGVFVSLDLFFFFFFYELAVIPMYLLIGVWGSSTDFSKYRNPLNFFRSKEYSAMKLVIVLSAGSILVWVGFIAMALYVDPTTPTFDFLVLREVAFSTTFQRVFFLFFMIGFGVLAGLWPFHTWSPDGHVAAPTSVSMLHAGVLMKLGAFGILRIGMELTPEGASFWMPLLIVLATVNVVYGAISAMGQQDLKYVIGYSSVSHMGYVLMGLATLDPLGVNGAVLQMFSHGVMTALFFVLVGGVYDRAHVRDINVLEGLAKRMGTGATFFAIAGLASLGLPGLSGFVAELLVFIGAFRSDITAGPFAIGPLVGTLGVFAAAITAVYILRLLARVFFGQIGERWERLSDISRVETVAGALLIAFIVAIGIYPFPWIDLIEGSIATVLGRIG